MDTYQRIKIEQVESLAVVTLKSCDREWHRSLGRGYVISSWQQYSLTKLYCLYLKVGGAMSSLQHYLLIELYCLQGKVGRVLTCLHGSTDY